MVTGRHGLLLVLLCLLEGTATAFAPKATATSLISQRCSGWTTLLRTGESAATGDPKLTPPEEKVYGLLEEIHASKLDFRVVVVGNGAILETTAKLGPNFMLNKSPNSGANLVTFASEDKSFEFHLMTAQVSKIVFTENQGPTGRTMRILRFINDVGKPICSLILADDNEEVAEWYKGMASKYGEELQL
jgi:hypothetical protein